MPGPLTVNHGTGFQAIYDQFKPGLLGTGGDQHVRFKGEQLYTHSSLSLHGRGAEAAGARAAKYESGAVQVRAALVRDFGAAVADRILAKVGSDVGRDLGKGITRSDLTRIKSEADAVPKRANDLVDAAIARPGSQIETKFRAHLRKEFSEENLDFTQAVADFRNAPANEKAAKAQAIYDRFIPDDAEKMINIPHPLRRDIIAAFTGDGPPPGPDVFDQAFGNIYDLMTSDSAVRLIGASKG